MFANVAVSIGFAVDWSAPVASVGYQATRKDFDHILHLRRGLTHDRSVFGLGILLSSLSKHANHTNNPGKPHSFDSPVILVHQLFIPSVADRERDLWWIQQNWTHTRSVGIVQLLFTI